MGDVLTGGMPAAAARCDQEECFPPRPAAVRACCWCQPLPVLQVCRLLLRSGADASREDADGQTAQQLAPSSWTCW